MSALHFILVCTSLYWDLTLMLWVCCLLSCQFCCFYFQLFVYSLIILVLLVFVAVRGLSLVVWVGATLLCGAQASHCGGISCHGAFALGVQASAVAAQQLNSCGARAQLPRGVWHLPGLGIEPVCPELAGWFLSPVPLEKSCCVLNWRPERKVKVDFVSLNYTTCLSLWVAGF